MRNNRQIGEFKVENSSEKYLTIQTADLFAGNVTLKASGTGILYYRYSVVGIPTAPPVEENKIITNGGRVLGVTAIGDDIPKAIDKAYHAVSKIKWDGAHFRNDIGKKALKRI